MGDFQKSFWAVLKSFWDPVGDFQTQWVTSKSPFGHPVLLESSLG